MTKGNSGRVIINPEDIPNDIKINISKETVIARGKVVYREESYGDNVYIGDADILSELFDYAGKTIEIIIREVADE